MSEVINIFIGFDEPNPVSYDVCVKSILAKNTKYKLNIQPINYNTLKEYERKKDPFESTQFAFARFFVPYISKFTGISIFLDGDFLFIDSIDNLIDQYNDKYAIMCCQHDYKPTNLEKMDGKPQTQWPRKNWSSLMIFNNEHPKNKTLTPMTVNNQSGAFLHRFKWLEDTEIGSLPLQWNWLVGWYKEPQDGIPKALHYTEGGPWLDNFKDCEYADRWLEEASNI
jgi:lipopolysaccharide biosynthesis glycosyltransferase